MKMQIKTTSLIECSWGLPKTGIKIRREREAISGKFRGPGCEISVRSQGHWSAWMPCSLEDTYRLFGAEVLEALTIKKDHEHANETT